MKRTSYILTVLLIAWACNNEGSKKEQKDTSLTGTGKPVQDESVVADGHDARNSLDWAGTYKGVLPCADCEGTETEILLQADRTFMFSEKHPGKKNEKMMKEEGKWTWLDGSTIELTGIKDRPSKYFVTEDRIFQLDREGKKIEGSLSEKYVLTKVK